ncbi:MAG: hypothetical protein ACXWJ8_05970 [Xanthobacteraceae bacterium]
MQKWLILAASAAALISFAPAPSMAQGVVVGVPGVGGVQIGEPDRPRYREREHRREYREREVRGRGCRTVTIERDDGSMRRIRRCD